MERLIVDTSALLCRYLPDWRRELVDRALASASSVVVTALAQSEVMMAVRHAVGEHDRSSSGAALLQRVADDLDRFWIVNIDDRVIRRAADLGFGYGVNLVNAIHLAALEPLPRPASLLTFDDRQVAAAADLGFELIDGEASGAGAHGLLADR